MNWLIELLLDLVIWLVPWPWHRGEPRSVVGESDLDREARRTWIWILAILLTTGTAASLWIYFKS